MKHLFLYIPVLVIFCFSCTDSSLISNEIIGDQKNLESRGDCDLEITLLDNPESECCKFQICVPDQEGREYYTIESNNSNVLFTASSNSNSSPFNKPKYDPYADDLYPVAVTCWEVTTCENAVIDLYKRNFYSDEAELICSEVLLCEEVEEYDECCDDLCFEVEVTSLPDHEDCFKFMITIEGAKECIGASPFLDARMEIHKFLIESEKHFPEAVEYEVCPNPAKTDPSPYNFEFTTMLTSPECGPFQIGPLNPFDINQNLENLCRDID